ncbi:hypothetical protein P7H74_14440 [Enterococcus devriesei]|uniref:AbiJ-related protein n=1 Tax=Enterococcus devriesei TaxID=319970 RepID=UPI00288E4FBF|nr:hypothetical protein [Enterococcus devriesei]MDT2822951.1 hypothetical protein [Enterococcus devriesei]
MNRISEITKRDILDLFRDGIVRTSWLEHEELSYQYFGRFEEIKFLERLYDLEQLPSLDSRYANAKRDIWQHTVNNDDYPFCWVFEDERFGLVDGSDEKYLRFICEIFHPAVRNEKESWKEFFDEVNKLLKNDGYELYPSDKISNREKYDWRFYESNESKLLIPYSQRNRDKIKNGVIKLKISRTARQQIHHLIDKYDIMEQITDESGWNYSLWISQQVMNDIKQFYIPKFFNPNNDYIETDDLEEFVVYGSPYGVLDVLEIFADYCIETDFSVQLNQIIVLNKLSFKMVNGHIEGLYVNQIGNNIQTPIYEVGLKELIDDAMRYYEEGNVKIAVEKMWDAFERLKTYYGPELNKKDSAQKIIRKMSNNVESYMVVFEREFNELTKIGNNFRIRHHEKNKINLIDERHTDYFYKRCLTLISTAIQYLTFT